MTRRPGESIGARIRRLREERGLTQRALAGPGVSSAYVSRIESGDRNPSGRALHTIAGRLGVSPELLLSGEDDAVDQRREIELGDAYLELRFADNPAAAAKKFGELVREAGEAGDDSAAERARAGLGLALVQQGDYEEAVALLKPIVEHRRLRPAAEPDVFFALARGYLGLGLGSAAVDLLRESVSEARGGEGGNGGYVRLATYLSYALTQVGDAAAARDVLDEALQRSEEAVDPRERVRLYWSHARLATSEGDHAAAHRYIQRAIAILEEAEDTLQLASAQLLSAESLIEQGGWEEADRRLEIAERLLGQREQPTRRMLLALLRSEVLNARRDYAAAEKAARDVCERARDDEPEFLGRAEMQLGEALWRQGRNDEAHEAFARAEDLLGRAEPRFLSALFARWADLLESEGRLAEALAMLRRSSRPTRAVDEASAASAGLRGAPPKRARRAH